MLHDARRCELPRGGLMSERGTLMVMTNAGSFVLTARQSVIDGITASRKTFGSTVYQRLFLLTRRAGR